MLVDDASFTKYDVKVRSILVVSDRGMVIATMYSTDPLDVIRQHVRALQQLVNAG